MKKEDLEKLLSNDSGDFELYPIDRYLHAVATERQVPDLAIAVCTIRIEESAPALLSVLEKAAEGNALSDNEDMLLFRGLYILGGARESAAYRPLLHLLRRPAAEVDHFLGDAVTEGLSRIVAGVFDGDADALFNAIGDPGVDEFAREALFGAATFLTWDGRIEHGRMRLFIERFHVDKMADDENQVWIGWLESIAYLGWRDLAPLVYSAWDEGRIPWGVMERRDFEEDLRAAEQAPQDAERFERANLGYIEDVLVALDWTRGLEPEDDLDDDDWQSRWPDRGWAPIEPATNPFRNVGRNDPCPCGSGKKFKKCCLEA
ncbi:DUF1186 domain-containing protein [Mesorhizobium sp. WSM4976]|uniref:DUF1186 domain-containing protein n=1 Tax=Mesorhizobium sp. WSM4976 TaxID=3038549 RepID=UPI002415BC27|nr:DUF1186 domain-containing protein [Mesorhizobium sp. WSM4976]MDG4898063.1 DUF1186 domain-containing protein [Mesorhizobium sp. WSM4976]